MVNIAARHIAVQLMINFHAVRDRAMYSLPSIAMGGYPFPARIYTAVAFMIFCPYPQQAIATPFNLG